MMSVKERTRPKGEKTKECMIEEMRTSQSCEEGSDKLIEAKKSSQDETNAIISPRINVEVMNQAWM